MLKGYKVRVFHVNRDKVFDYFVSWQDATQQSEQSPQRIIATCVARRRCALECNEELDPRIMTVLDVIEQW